MNEEYANAMILAGMNLIRTACENKMDCFNCPFAKYCFDLSRSHNPDNWDLQRPTNWES